MATEKEVPEIDDSTEEPVKKERKKRTVKIKSDLPATVREYSEAVANMTNDDGFILTNTESLSLGKAIDKLLEEYSIDINSKYTSVINFIFVLGAVVFRRKPNILALIKKFKTKNEKQKTDIQKEE